MKKTTDNKLIELVLADDHSLVINGLEELLRRCSGMKVTGTATDGERVVALVGLVQPDIVLLDIRMPLMDGFQAARLIKSRYPATGLIALSGDERPHSIMCMIEAGFDGIVLKSAEEEEIFAAIQHVYRGLQYFCRHSHQLLLALSARGIYNPKRKAIKKFFSDQEAKILKMICDGSTCPQIAEVLEISERTVESHREKLYTKTGTRRVNCLVKWAVLNGYS